MKKIQSLFQRNYESDNLVRDEVVLGSEWVLNGEGIATRKFDGTCCMIRGGKLFKRYDAKQGKTPPAGFEPAQEPDPITSHWPGWLPVGDGPEDKWFREAWDTRQTNPIDGSRIPVECIPDHTCELIGPKIQGNPEKVDKHLLVPHDFQPMNEVPHTFSELKKWFSDKDIEGIVWHHPDGRMVKIKKIDFGFKR